MIDGTADRLRHDLKSFAMRVRMTRTNVVIVVEGRRIDPTFYDELCNNNPDIGLRGHLIVPVDTIDLGNGTKRHGKDAVLMVHRELAQAESLSVVTRTGVATVLCAVDRDLDRLNGELSDSPHLSYTVSRDVESEVHLNAPKKKALRVCLSLTREEANRLSPSVKEAATYLADAWREWIELGILIARLDVRCQVRPGGKSTVNTPTYGPLDTSAYQQAKQHVTDRADSETIVAKEELAMLSDIAGFYERKEQHLLVKGKWLPPYVLHLVESEFSVRSVDRDGFKESYIKCLLARLDFNGEWTAPYHSKLSALP